MNSVEKELFKLLFINEFFSTCCDEPANVGGDNEGTVRFYYCSHCGKHCEAVTKGNEKEMLYVTSQNEEEGTTANS